MRVKKEEFGFLRMREKHRRGRGERGAEERGKGGGETPPPDLGERNRCPFPKGTRHQTIS